MKWSLADFPSEVLAYITPHLHGFVVLRLLYMTGSRVLWRKLQHGGVTHLELSPELSSKSDLQQFDRLLSLDVACHGLQASEFASLLDRLPISLTRLRMVGRMAEYGWTRPETEKEALDVRNVHFKTCGSMPVNLSKRLPHLRDLSLHGMAWLTSKETADVWTPGMMIAFLRMLPRGLTSLHMHHLNDCELPYFPYLPPHLTKLISSENPVRAIPEHLPDSLQNSLLSYYVKIYADGEIAPFPPNLTSLTCARRWDRLFKPGSPVLPSGLTSLSFESILGWLKYDFNDEELLLLPPTLKRLHFSNFSSTFSDTAQWPRMLTDLKIIANEPFTNAKQLPQSLTSLRITRRAHSDPFDLSSFPPSLQSLHTNIIINSNDEIQQLPKNLTALTVMLKSSTTHITWWPASLVSLNVLFWNEGPYWNLESVLALPKKLTHLQTSRMPDYVVQALPLTLTRLQIRSVSITGGVRMDYDPSLPADTVKIPNFLYFDPLRFRASLNGPSPSEYGLSLCQPFSSRRCLPMDAHLTQDEVAISTQIELTELPPHITSLEFSETLVSPPFDDSETPFNMFSNLKSLVCNLLYSSLPLNMSGLIKLERLIFVSHTPDALTQYPPNLTELRVRQSDQPFHGPLPTTLRKLSSPSSLSVLEPLKQLQSLKLDGDWFSNDDGCFLSLIDSLPCLTQLKARFNLSQTNLEALVTRGRTIKLKGVNSFSFDRPEAISEIWGIKPLESASLEQFLYQAIITYYPYLPTLEPSRIEINYWNEKVSRNIFVHALLPHLTTLYIGPFNLPERFTRWLPRTITDLNIAEVIGTSHRTSSGLPPSLTRLMISGNGFGLLSYQHLPKTITELKFVNQRKFWPKYAKNLPPSLRILTLDVLLTSNDMIAELPKSIISLDFGRSARTITGPALRNLPPNLTYLGGSFHSVNDDAFYETFSRILSSYSYWRKVSSNYEIRHKQIQIALASSSLDELTSHLTR